MRLHRAALTIASVGAVACNSGETGFGIVVRAPDRVQQAQTTSGNLELCDQLDVRFTFTPSGGTGTAVYDDEPLEPVADKECTWQVEGRDSVEHGEYDSVARFATALPVASGDCAAGTELAVGAFVVLNEPFPFDQSSVLLPDELFFSGVDGELEGVPVPEGESALDVQVRYADTLDGYGLDFDPDADNIDNLSELQLETSPCESNLRPILEAPVPEVGEEEWMRFPVTLDPNGTPGELGWRMRIRHANDLGAAGGIYSTAELVVTVAPGTDSATFAPEPGAEARERWAIEVIARPDDGTGVRIWDVDFLPDEPLVGDLTIELEVLTRGGEGLAMPSLHVTATDTNDPVRLFFTDVPDPEDWVETNVIGFKELEELPSGTPRYVVPPALGGGAPTVQALRFEDDDIPANAGRVASLWTVSYSADDIPLYLAVGTGRTELVWDEMDGSTVHKPGPSNDDAIRQPPGGWQQRLDFYDQEGALVESADFWVKVAPAWNQPVRIRPPAGRDRVLPESPFAEHVISFQASDPDRHTAPPSCVVEVTGGPCAAPFSVIECTSAGALDLDTWPMRIRVVPAADYDAACGADPTFQVSITVTDAPPLDAGNGPQTTNWWCDAYDDGDDCATRLSELTLLTNPVAITSVLLGGPAAPVYDFVATSPPLVHGPSGRALVALENSGDYADASIFLLDLNDPTAAFRYELPRDVLCEMRDSDPAQEQGAVWEGGDEPRFLVVGKYSTDGQCDIGTEYGVLWMELPPSDLDAPDLIARDVQDFCPSSGNPAYASVDSAGDFWVSCDYDDVLSRVGPGGALSQEIVPGLNPTSLFWEAGATVVGSDGTEWLVMPDTDGFVLVDLASFDGVDGGLVTERTSLALGFGDLITHVVDARRNAYLFLRTSGVAGGPGSTEIADLYRITFAPTPTLEGPMRLESGANAVLQQTNSGIMSRLILRDDPGAPAVEPDLVFDMNYDDSDVAYVNLDVPLGSGTPVIAPFIVFDYTGFGLHPTPLPRFFISLARDEPLKLFPYDPQGAVLEVAVDVPVQGYGSGNEVAMSRSGGVILIADDDSSAPLQAVYFLGGDP